MAKQWEYTGSKNEEKLMNFMGKQGWEAYAVINGWAFYKRPVQEKLNPYRKKEPKPA